MIIYRISQLQITVSSLKLSFSHLMENGTCSVLNPLGFSVQTLVFISECSELIIITAEKPVLVSRVQKCLLYVLTAKLQIGFRRNLVFFSLCIRASGKRLESVASPPVAG